ncbi:outer membrane beta-barrel protein [bacterium BMS3Abin03]|nr:outer membrane beta-barrel protein [bacterium BMS3Abin03]
MKTFILIILFCSFTISYSQNDTAYNSYGRFFITPTLRYNIPATGIKLNIGYNISEHFSIILSSGYMRTFTDSHNSFQQSVWDDNAKDYLETTSFHAEHTHQFIPVDLTLRYNFYVFGIQTYVMYQAGWNYLFNEGDYDVTLLTKYKNSDQIVEAKTGKASDIYNSSRTNSSFGNGLGAGVLVPLTDLLKIDISCSYIHINYGLDFLSLGAGLNFIIK